MHNFVVHSNESACIKSGRLGMEQVIYEMPAVQLSALLLEHDEVIEKLKKLLKNDIVQAAIRELVYAHGRCQVPPLDELLNDNIDEPLDWDPVVNFIKTPAQTDPLYKE